jgi:iron(III) transport system substrate-binding protein
MRLRILGIVIGASLSMAALASTVTANEVNIYNARHYGTDQQLWDGFTKATGIEGQCGGGQSRRPHSTADRGR